MDEQRSSCTWGSGGKNQIIYSCSGVGSNVGQLANEAACRLTLEGYGGGSCLAGLGGGIDKLIGMGMAADERVVIDGCPVACAKTIMDNRRLPIDHYVVITELGITKTLGPAFNERDVQTVIDAVKNSSR